MPAYTLFTLRKNIVCNQFLLGSDLGKATLVGCLNQINCLYTYCVLNPYHSNMNGVK